MITSKKMFIDGISVYNNIDKSYNKHKKGIVILGPPGIGKSTWLKNQKKTKGKKDWIDTDYLSTKLNVKHNLNKTNPIDFELGMRRSDYMLAQSKLLGYRIIGALFWEFKADAMVIPPLKQHLLYTSKRKDLNVKLIKQLRKTFKEQAKILNIPIFNSIDKAFKYTTEKNK